MFIQDCLPPHSRAANPMPSESPGPSSATHSGLVAKPVLCARTRCRSHTE
jgi:hypothetical protein